jgi:hypothetical protein
MLIENVPSTFQPFYQSVYPGYSSGKNIEEICYDYFSKECNNIESDLIYLPVFWTSYYVINNYGENIEPLYDWLHSLDKTKKYFTIVQYASGIYIKDPIHNLTVFSAGGGGLNIKSNCIRVERFYNLRRHVFYGNTGDYTIPLICLPSFPYLNMERNIFCSFMGRFNTHKCRKDMHRLLRSNAKFTFYKSVGFEEYKNILNTSIFTLAPRGYGYTSFRIYEAILAESIPIYIWEDKKVLPFEDVLNWEEFSIVIHANDMNQLPDILDKCNIESMQSKLREVKQCFMFEYIFEYITNKIG